ncbi:UNVERIFIED_CONTAM: Retrovirus-related Pol polyprotein from transposon TNT 1-94 [Sesamum latifolium]|uniref:Retrovirus-related Pol polyprotein from transposon TNT 1-94 n=1 Tax=Sesamum latifolium TaxID=2727402 RepID=A0AAW2WQS9_9LAMI
MGLMVLLVYVDDVLIVGASEESILELKAYLDSLFTIKYVGVAKYFIGLKIECSQRITVSQAKYIKDMLADAWLLGVKSATTPLLAGIKFTSKAGNVLYDLEPYGRLVGRLLYLSFTQPDISHASQQLSQFMKQPCKEHWDATLPFLRYLKGSSAKGLFFPATVSTNLVA